MGIKHPDLRLTTLIMIINMLCLPWLILIKLFGNWSLLRIPVYIGAILMVLLTLGVYKKIYKKQIKVFNTLQLQYIHMLELTWPPLLAIICLFVFKASFQVVFYSLSFIDDVVKDVLVYFNSSPLKQHIIVTNRLRTITMILVYAILYKSIQLNDIWIDTMAFIIPPFTIYYGRLLRMFNEIEESDL